MLNRLLNGVIRWALQQRVLVLALSLFLLAAGVWQMFHLPIDVFPDLDRPRVVVMTEAPGLAPEEVESLITFPLESVLNGATGVQAVRTQSAVGLSVVQVEFDWGTDIYDDRQVVAERLAVAADRLPAGVRPQLAPISSIMGQIMIAGMWSDLARTSPMELRTLADWVVRQRLLTVPGVSQVFVMGGERKQFQVLVDPAALLRYGVTLLDVETALAASNENATGGYLDKQGPNELLVRALGRVRTVEELQDVVVATRSSRPVTVGQVARVVEGPEVKRGTSAAYSRNADGSPSGGSAVLLTVNKQPNADTRRVTQLVTAALQELRSNLPEDVRLHTELYQQRAFIDRAVSNVIEALRDGSLLVVLVLFLFLFNLRTTFITLTAIPLSLAITCLVFAGFGFSINTMTLGGLAVAIGELVDDAIVDVENIFRRLRENRIAAQPQQPLAIVYRASTEIRNSIVFGTLIVVLAFLPVFALGGMEGRLFAPVGFAYIVSIAASLLVSLTVTPVLSYWLLGGLATPALIGSSSAPPKDGVLLWLLKQQAGVLIRFSLRVPWLVLGCVFATVVISGLALWRLENDFLPPFDEGSVQINVVLPPGTSLATSEQVARRVEERLLRIDDLTTLVRKTGRAELDEHAIPVSMSEMIATIDPASQRPREVVLEEIREALADVPGIVTSVEQPLAHLISAMLSGVQAQVAIKLYGDDLEVMRREARRMQAAIAQVAGVKDLQLEPQVEIPQLRIELDSHQLKQCGLHRRDVNEFIETAMNGRVVSQVLVDQRTFDLLVRLDEPFREDIEAVKRLALELPDGGTVNLGSLVSIYESRGPNTINREHVRRRIVLQCNVAGRGLVDVIRDIQARLAPIEQTLPPGYLVAYGGQFESQRAAAQAMAVSFSAALIGMFLVLYGMFRSANLSLQVMVALPMAFIGSVAALYLTGQTLTVAAMVGFISLSGIASRNGILLINHYLYLVRNEGEQWTREMIVRGGQQRVAPVLMTALTSGVGLVPLALAGSEPGKEILYPVATVIIGGLTTSTLLEFLVRPAMFWLFGCAAGEKLLAQSATEVALAE